LLSKLEFIKSRTKPGQASIFDSDLGKLFTASIPNVAPEKNIKDELIHESFKQKENIIYQKVLSKNTKGKNWYSKKTATTSTEPKPKPKMSQELEMIARIINNPPQSFMSQGEIFDYCKIPGGAKKNSIKNEALKKGLVRIHPLQVGKARRNYWEITPRMRELLNLPKPNIPGKGGFVHQLVAYYVNKWANQNSYKCKLEAQLGNSNKAADAVLTKDGESLVFEICVSEPFDKELSNISKDFASGFKFSKLILLALDGKMKKKLKSIIDNDLFASQHKDMIEVKLAGDYIKIK